MIRIGREIQCVPYAGFLLGQQLITLRILLELTVGHKCGLQTVIDSNIQVIFNPVRARERELNLKVDLGYFEELTV